MWPGAEVKLAGKIQTEYESCGCSSTGGLNEGRQNGQNAMTNLMDWVLGKKKGRMPRFLVGMGARCPSLTQGHPEDHRA